MSRWSPVLAALCLAAGAPSGAEEPPRPMPPLAPAGPTPTKPAEEPTVGEVITLPYNRTAAYGPTRVRGPAVNLTDSGNGEWKGNIRSLDGVFRVTETRISGGNLNLVMDREGDDWTCQGTVDGKRVRIAVEKGSLTARYDDRLYDLKRVSPDLWATVPSGPGVRVKGDAAGSSPYYPQFIFALLAVL